jgi:hypothetical protein
MAVMLTSACLALASYLNQILGTQMMILERGRITGSGLRTRPGTAADGLSRKHCTPDAYSYFLVSITSFGSVHKLRGIDLLTKSD